MASGVPIAILAQGSRVSPLAFPGIYLSSVYGNMERDDDDVVPVGIV